MNTPDHESLSAAHRAKISAKLKAYYADPANREKARQASKLAYEDKELRAKVGEAARRIHAIKAEAVAERAKRHLDALNEILDGGEQA